MARSKSRSRPAPELPREPAAAAWRPRWIHWLGAVFLVSLIWRLLYLDRLSHSPLWGSLTEDSLLYWKWSDFLMHHGLWGKNPFFMGPLYPYALALLRPISGNTVGGILFVQALWGAAAAALLADATRRLARPWIGVAVGLWVGLYEMAVFFDGLVLMESLLFFLEALLLWWVVRTDWRRAGFQACLVAGALIGWIAEGRASSAVLLLPAIGFLAFVPGTARRAAGRRAALFLTGFVLVALPGAIRNLAVSGEWIPFTYNGGVNLYLSNSELATGGFARPTGTSIVGVAVAGTEDGGAAADTRDYLRKLEHVDLGPNASSAWWSKRARGFIAAHPGRALALAVRKIGMMWNRREYPQIENVDEFRGMAGPVGLPFLGTFLLLGALAFGGLFPAWRRGAAGRFLVGYAGAMTLAVALFFVTDRYRHHLVPAAAVLAGLCVDALAGVAAQSRLRPAVFATALAGLVLVNLPAPQLGRAKSDWGMAFDMGTRWAEQGRLDRAVVEYERALRMESSGAVRLDAIDRADLYYDYANTLSRLGRGSEAVTYWERAVGTAPDHALAIHALANARAAAGQTAEAESLYRVLDEKPGGHLLALDGRAHLAAAQGRLEEAERLFAEIVQETPTQYAAWGALVRGQAEAAKLPEAARSLAEAARQGMPAPELHAHEALLAAMAGDRASAEKALAQVPAGAVERDPELADVVAVTRRLLPAR